MAVPPHDDWGAAAPLNIGERRRAEDALRQHAERQALLLKVSSDLIRTSEPSELARVTFEHISPAFGADVCFNYRLDPVEQRLRLVFVRGVPPDKMCLIQSLDLGQALCGMAALSSQSVVADKARIDCDPNGDFARGLGATAYACHPIMSADGRVLGTFSIASTTRDGFSEAEVAWLGTVTNFLAQAWERFEAEQGLRVSEERFRSSLLHSPLPVLLFDDREEILALSASWLRGTGYSREELRRIEDWTTRAFGERSAAADRRFREIISTEPEAQTDEMTVRTKDGRERLWSFVYSALGTQSDGRRLFVCLAQDVTERKAHEEHIHLLMREVNHRAKNMLSVVDSIARRTAATNPGDFIERFSERIQALSANQDLLVRNEWNGVGIEDLVRAQLAHVTSLIGQRITVHGPALHLTAASAQAIGLALHELATNAGKYGALSTDSGRIDIAWGIDRDALTFSWTEKDGPAVSAPKRRGFGTLVVEAMVERSVAGKVDLVYLPSGVSWRLTCPAANALEPGEREPRSNGENGVDSQAQFKLA